jgi:Ca2+ transporting ATPase
LLITGDEIAIDESNVTGESEHIKKFPLEDKDSKNVPSPILLADTMVVLGKGLAVVCAVGINTQTGEVEEKLFTDDDEGTPLQQKLERVADFIGKIGVYVALATLLALIVNIFLNRILSNLPLFTVETTDQIVNSFIIAITVVVVAVPEGLPLAVTLSLAYSVS